MGGTWCSVGVQGAVVEECGEQQQGCVAPTGAAPASLAPDPLEIGQLCHYSNVSWLKLAAFQLLGLAQSCCPLRH